MAEYQEEVKTEVKDETPRADEKIILAVKLSETALELETASKNGELDHCLNVFPAFEKQLSSLRQRLTAVFPGESGASDSEKEAGDMDYLRANVQKATAAADDFDSDAGLEAIQPLLDYDFGERNNTLLAKAAQAFNAFDCGAAAGILKEINP
ncbi:MAG: hypothetical protein LBL26_00310 [Peptococcaceae bacterium]|jgi:hypothetical protein|nr:hypothetical protein [Peptococcaceae bacterium]